MLDGAARGGDLHPLNVYGGGHRHIGWRGEPGRGAARRTPAHRRHGGSRRRLPRARRRARGIDRAALPHVAAGALPAALRARRLLSPQPAADCSSHGDVVLGGAHRRLRGRGRSTRARAPAVSHVATRRLARLLRRGLGHADNRHLPSAPRRRIPRRRGAPRNGAPCLG